MRIFRDLLATALVVIAFVAIFEGGLRLTGVRYEYSFYESDPVLYTTYRPYAEGWEVKESENFVRMNSHGMRDRERSIVPAPGTTRIALLGDSVIAATQVPLENTMGQVLERRLSSSFGGRNFEVLNFAQGGNTLAQQHLMLRDRVWAFRPQIVVVFVTPISVPTANRKLDTVAAPKPFYIIRAGELIPDPKNHPPAASAPDARRRNGILKNVMNQYRLLLVLRQATDQGADKLKAMRALTRSANASAGGGEVDHNKSPMDIWFRPPGSADVQEAWQVAEGLLRLIAADTRGHGVELWMASVGPAVQEDPDARDRLAYLNGQGYGDSRYSEDRFETFARNEGIPYLRMSPRILAHAERQGVSVRGFFNTLPNQGHWNVEGNSAAAGILGDELLSRSSMLRTLREVGPRPIR